VLSESSGDTGGGSKIDSRGDSAERSGKDIWRGFEGGESRVDFVTSVADLNRGADRGKGMELFWRIVA
jgi:hypothetical protein